MTEQIELVINLMASSMFASGLTEWVRSLISIIVKDKPTQDLWHAVTLPVVIVVLSITIFVIIKLGYVEILLIAFGLGASGLYKMKRRNAKAIS